MGLKDLLVYVDQSDRARVRLQLAIDLARRHDSTLTGLFVRTPNPEQLEKRKAAELGLASAGQVQRLDRDIEHSMDECARRLESELRWLGREHGLQVEWRSMQGPLAMIAPQQARYHDLCVLGHEAGPDRATSDYSFTEHMLFVTGRPVLLVPPGWAASHLGRHVAIAWNSSRAAARALSDAMALIERAERTTVLSINPAEFIERRGAPPVTQLLEHLQRHGARVDTLTLEPVPPAQIARTLQSKAAETGADVLVAGAFAHPRLWEKFFGGVTAELLDHTLMPLLMSH